MSLIYISIESHFWELDVLNVHIFLEPFLVAWCAMSKLFWCCWQFLYSPFAYKLTSCPYAIRIKKNISLWSVTVVSTIQKPQILLPFHNDFYCVVSLKQNKALNSGSYLVHDQKDVSQWPIEEWIKIFVCQVVWWGQVLDVCQFWLRGQGRVYTWCWLLDHLGLIILALKHCSLRLTLIIWIGFCSKLDS